MTELVDGAAFRSAAASGEPGTGAAPGPAAAPPGRPRVIYIAGSGRSGSTLLERALGEIPGFVNVGELIDLFRRTAALGERCGCGTAFADCTFWGGVGERAFNGWSAGTLSEMHRLQLRVARQRHLPRLLALPLAGRGFRANAARYGELYARLYGAIAAEAGVACIVDASKWPVQALALARAGMDLRVIHLVRDVRGVAHSLGKRHIARPQAVRAGDHMSHSTPAAAAVRWVACQGGAELLRRCGLPVARMRYEDFVAAPRRAVQTALAALGLAPGPGALDHIQEGRLLLGPSHGLSGNPSRFRHGQTVLRADETWRDTMRRRDRIVVTAIGFPLLLRYRRRGTPGDSHD